jgi:hypothetical protein|tara:strand:+ start:298 stop:474 length:177 start_codon:yes stop_codon:yes gene_type:complete
MYEELNCFEEALKHFGTRVEFAIAMEMGRKISSEDAYQIIKTELKDLKKCRKKFKNNE